MAHPDRKRPSSKDVAEAAGVSRTTVSFVLNDRPGSAIPESTRKRVLDAAETLGYFPSPEAKALKSGRSSIVLCLLPDWPITGPLGILLKQTSAHLAKHGLTMLSHQRTDTDDLQQVLQSTTPTAVVAMCDLTADEAQFARRRDVDLLSWMGSIPGCPDVASLRQSDVGGLQVSAMAELGHRHVAYASPNDPQLAWFSDPRLQGASAKALELGLGFVQFGIAEDATSTAAAIESALAAGATAVCAYNDEVAYSVIAAAHELGRTVPGDMSVIGVDDSVISRLSNPSITSIAFELAHEAERLAVMVVNLGSATAPQPTGFAHPIRLVPRSSTASPSQV